MGPGTAVAALLADHRHAAWEDFDALAWVLVISAALVAAWVIWKAVRYTLRPGEAEDDHIKRSILKEPPPTHDVGLQVTLSSGEADGGGSRPAAPSGDGA